MPFRDDSSCIGADFFRRAPGVEFLTKNALSAELITSEQRCDRGADCKRNSGVGRDEMQGRRPDRGGRQNDYDPKCHVSIFEPNADSQRRILFHGPIIYETKNESDTLLRRYARELRQSVRRVSEEGSSRSRMGGRIIESDMHLLIHIISLPQAPGARSHL